MAGVDVSIPPAFFELESERDACRTQGAYHEAGVAQRRLERAKREHEQQRLQALKERHAQEQAELDQRNRDEFRVFTQGWEEKRAELTRTIQAQEEQLQQRHREMLEGFEQQCREEPVKPKWSRTLLNMRVQEEHLIKQRRFPAAAKLKAQADQLEAREEAQAAEAQQLRQGMEGAKLQAQCTREAEALHKKLQASYSDHMLTHERELDKLMKRTSTSKLMLTRTQAHQLLQLEQALKGWFNPRKLGLPPPPLNMPPPPMSPGVRVSLARPGTTSSGSPFSPSSTGVLSSMTLPPSSKPDRQPSRPQAAASSPPPKPSPSAAYSCYVDGGPHVPRALLPKEVAQQVPPTPPPEPPKQEEPVAPPPPPKTPGSDEEDEDSEY